MLFPMFVLCRLDNLFDRYLNGVDTISDITIRMKSYWWLEFIKNFQSLLSENT